MRVKVVLRILKGVAAAAEHLHARGIMHGDLYAHNILNDPLGHALLGDFGAASVYAGMDQKAVRAMEQMEVKAFGYLIEDLLSLVAFDAAMVGEKEWGVVQELLQLKDMCVVNVVAARPLFSQVCDALLDL